MRMKKVIALTLASVMAFSAWIPGSTLQAKAAPSGKSTQDEPVLPLDQVAVHGREKLNFNQGWKFVRQYIAEAIDVDYPTETLERWESVNLPHTVRVEPFNNSGGINYQGQAMYRKQFTVPEEYAGKKLFVEFEGAMGVTDVWVNGTHLQTKSSAKTGSYTNVQMYLPFVLDITDVVTAGSEENVITVLVDNSDNWNVPPGKPQGQLDYTYPGGIYRNVWIEVADPVHITDATFEDIAGGGGILVDYPQVSEESAEVAVNTHIRNESDEEQTVQLVTEVVDKEDQVVASADAEQVISSAGDFTFEQTMTVSDPELWNIDTPYLYTLVSSVFVDGVEVDQEETKIGIRTIDFSAEGGLKINGEDGGFLQGVNRHQEYAYLGYAASSSLQRRDAIKFKEAGINFVRASCHTPSADFLDACDELGIFVMEAIPGWQHWSTAPEFAEREREEVKYMIRRDRNRPSILTFEISLNESTSVPTEFTNELAAIARAEHPSIQISAENPHAGASADVLYGTPEQVASWSDTACSVIREYADHWIEQQGDFSTICRVTRGPGSFYPGGEAAMVYQANRALWTGFPHYFGTGAISLADAYKMYEDTNHRFIGVNKWIGIDHNRGYHSTMSPCGLWDLARLPKYMYYAYESQRSVEKDDYLESLGVETGAMIFVASTWSEKAPVMDKYQSGMGIDKTLGTDESRIIYVYSNAERVRLSVIGSDGAVLWNDVQSPSKEHNGEYLPHAPFEFGAVPYTAGSYLKAEGLDADGNVITEQEVHTAGAPAKLELEVDYEGIDLTADGSDAVMVYAHVLDADGNICQTADNELTFQVSGPGSLVGDGDMRVGTNPINAEAGIAGVYIQSGMEAGDIEITVSADGLESGSVTIVSKEMTQKVMPYTQLAQGAPLDSASMYLTSKEETIIGGWPRDYSKGTVSVNGTDYVNSLNLLCMTGVEYELKGAYERLTAKAALENPEKTENGTIFKVYLDGVLRYASEPVTDQVIDIDLDISGAESLVLETEDAKGVNTSRVLWLSPYVYEGTGDIDESELRENLALGKSVSATSSQEGNKAELAVDGDALTMWQSKETVSEGAPQSLVVDLGKSCDIRNARVGLKYDYFKYFYTISVSKDGTNWEEKAVTEKTAHASDDLDLFTAADIRYVKIEFTKIESAQSQDSLFADVVEFEVYADKGVDSVSEYNLKGLGIGGKNLVFDPGQTEYRLDLSGCEDKLYVKALSEDPAATVILNGEELPKTEAADLRETPYYTVDLKEQNQITAEVMAANGIGRKVYTVTIQDDQAEEGIYHAADCFVPGINGANNWYYQAQNKDGSFVTIDSAKGDYICSEYAWSDRDWLHAGPRFMHPATSGEKAVRTFRAPKNGEAILKVTAEKYLDQPGTVSLSVMKNGQKIWPEDASEKTFARGAHIEFETAVSLKKGDDIQILIGSASDGNGGDAVCMSSEVRYTDELSVAEVTIDGSEQVEVLSGQETKVTYRPIAKTADGMVIGSYECDWKLKEEADGISMDENGVLTISETAPDTEVIIQALEKGTEKVVAEKTVSIRRLDYEVAYLSDLEWVSANSGNGPVRKDQSTSDREICLFGQDGEKVTYEKGLGTHAPSEIIYDIKDAGYDRLSAVIGIDYNMGLADGADQGVGSVSFRIYFNDETDPVFDSGVMGCTTPGKEVSLELTPDVERIRLVVDQGNVNWCDHANWADAKFISYADEIAAEEVKLNLSEAELEEGESLMLETEVLPENTTDKSITWSSSDPAVAEVKDGVVTAVSEGTAVITAETANGKTASCNITVKWTCPFQDVKEEDWYYEGSKYVSKNGIMTGTGDDKTIFAPGAFLNRAEFAVILHRLEGKPEVEYKNLFTDVPEGTWFTDAVLWNAKNGVIKGYADTDMFGASDHITREQMAVMLYRYAALKNYDIAARTDLSRYEDAECVTEFAEEAMSWAVESGIILGKDQETRLDPQGSTNRAEAAVMLMRFMKTFC